MLNNLINSSNWQYWLIGAIALIVVLLFIFRKSAKVILAVGILAIIFGSGIYSYVQLDYYLSAESNIFGKIDGITVNNQVAVTETDFDLTNIELTKTENYNEYLAKFTSNEHFKLSEDVIYSVYINNNPCSYIEFAKDYVIANYTQVFYDYNKSAIFKDTLYFKISLFDNKTELRLTTKGGADAVEYWNNYFSKEKLNLAIKQTNNYSNSELANIHDYVQAKFMVDNKQFKNVLIKKNSTIGTVAVPETNKYLFEYWTLDGENQINLDEIQLTENTTFVAKIIYKWIVSFSIQESIVHNQYFLPGENIYATNYTPPESIAYTFLYWTLDGENEVNVPSVLITQNTKFIAKIEINIDENQSDFDKSMQYAFNQMFSRLHPLDIEDVTITNIGYLRVEIDYDIEELILSLMSTDIRMSDGSELEYFVKFTYWTYDIEKSQIEMIKELQELIQKDFTYEEFKLVFDSILQIPVGDVMDTYI